MTILLQRKHI